PSARYLRGAAGNFRRSTNSDDPTSAVNSQTAKMTDVVIWSKVPESASTQAQIPWNQIAFTGARESASRSASGPKKSPLRAIAYGTRAFIRVMPLSAPIADIMNADDTGCGPYDQNDCAAFAATGSASRYCVEFAVSTSPNGNA